jgi:hypothetical protein
MPGLQMFKKGFYSHIGANRPIAAATINLGCTKGRGSITRTLRSNSRNAHLYTKRNKNYGFNIGSHTRRRSYR